MRFSSFRSMSLPCVMSVMMLASGCATKSLTQLSDQEMTQRILSLSGTKDNLVDLPKSVDEWLLKQKEKFSSQTEVYEIMAQSFKEAFAVNRLLENMEFEVNQKLSRQDRLAVLEWYATPLGIKVSAMEEYMNSEKGIKVFNKYIDSFDLKTEEEKKEVVLDQPLLEFATRLTREKYSLQVLVDTMASVSLGSIMGFNSILNDNQKMNIFEIDQKILSIRQSLTEQLAPSVVLIMAFTYKDLNVDERQELLSFFSAGIGKKYIDTISRGMSLNLERAAMRVGDGVATGIADLPQRKFNGRSPASKK